MLPVGLIPQLHHGVLLPVNFMWYFFMNASIGPLCWSPLSSIISSHFVSRRTSTPVSSLPRCLACLIPGFNIVSLAHLRSELRKRLGIPGNHFDDMCNMCCCSFCTLMQMAQETSHIKNRRLNLPDGAWKNPYISNQKVITLAPSSNKGASSTDPVWTSEKDCFSVRL